jgi:ElaB/YqjD/DUF883 family membrane-anchored ribosome-binding protein
MWGGATVYRGCGFGTEVAFSWCFPRDNACLRDSVGPFTLIDGATMTALPNTRDALGESWTSTSRRARRIARHSRHAAEDIAGELRNLMSELESTLADGTQADAVALRGKLRKQLDAARARLNDTREAVRERAEVAIADADDYVHENPWQTVAIIGGVALIAGALFAARLR